MPSDITEAQARRLIAFAVERMGRQEGDGECWTLVNNGFQRLGFHKPSETYDWGRQLPNTAGARPGDVFQFSDVRVRVDQPDGAWQEQMRGMPRHTAILENIDSNGHATFLECNIGENRNVQRNRFHIRTADLSDGTTERTSGTIRVYRPQMP